MELKTHITKLTKEIIRRQLDFAPRQLGNLRLYLARVKPMEAEGIQQKKIRMRTICWFDVGLTSVLFLLESNYL